MSRLSDALAGFDLKKDTAKINEDKTSTNIVEKPINPLQAILDGKKTDKNIEETAITPESLGSIVLNINTDVTYWPDENNDKYDETIEGQLKKHLDTVAKQLNLGDVTEALHKAMIFIDKHIDELKEKSFLLPKDCGLLVRALQSSNGVIIHKKQENRTRRKQTSEEKDALVSQLGDLGF